MSTRVLGKEHPNSLKSMFNLALTLLDMGEKDAALDLLRKSLAGQCKVLGHQHPDTMAAAEFLARLEGESSGT